MKAGKWTGAKPKPKQSDSEYAPIPDMYNHAGKAQVINAAVRSLDAVARDAEVRWGIGKLESLADPELAARFEQARVRLNAALNGEDVNEVVARCKDMIKGWKVIEKRVREAGHQPADMRVWYHKSDDGRTYAFVQDPADATLVEKGAVAYSLDEVVRLLDQRYQTISTVKEHWPGAEVTKVKPKNTEKDFQDDIPF